MKKDLIFYCQYKIDLKYITIPDTLYESYYKNKSLTKKVELYYIKKSFEYKKIIDNLEEYYKILEKLYNTKEINDFKINLKKYSKVLKKIQLNN